MKVSELQVVFLDELKGFLPGWKFIKSNRHFRKVDGDVRLFFHISCVNHASDFDAVGDVAVEFMAAKQRVCIIGGELGNIEGIGQNRFPVSNREQAISSALEMYKCFERIGLPFLHKYKAPAEVLAALRKGGETARRISPLLEKHKEQIDSLSRQYNIYD